MSNMSKKTVVIAIRVPVELHPELQAAADHLTEGNLSKLCVNFLTVGMDDYRLFRSVGIFKLVQLWRSIPMLFVRRKLAH